MRRHDFLIAVCWGVFGGTLTAASSNAQEQFARQQELSAQQTPAIRVSVNRVNVGVVVTDATGKFVGGLQRKNFHIFDNGVEQPTTDFLAVEEPAQIVLLIEAGPAVYLLEGGHLQAARALLSGLSADDRVAVVKYADVPQPMIDFTTDKQAAAATFDNLRFNLGFGSLNLSASLCKVLDWLAASNGDTRGKKTIVLLSTGVDTSAAEDIQNLRQRLKSGDVRILAVSLTGNLRNPSPVSKKKSTSPKTAMMAQQFAEADALLRQIAESTGGHAYFPVDAKQFDAVFSEIAQIVRHEFSLAFVPPVSDAAIHSLEVRITPAPGLAQTQAGPLRVDYRQAYLAPGTGTP
jgi:VWFA-related protein